MLKMKPQYFSQLMQTANSLEKTLMLGNVEGKRRRQCRWDSEIASSIADSMGMNLSKLREMLKDRGAAESQTQLRDWTTTTNINWSLIYLHILIFLSWSFLLKQYFSKSISQNFIWFSKKKKEKKTQRWGWGVKEKREEIIYLGYAELNEKYFLKEFYPESLIYQKKKKKMLCEFA